ncbi:glutamyl-tRNA reductase [Dongshaea marina]|uniref:glutamyl-tRNA reductase n=1 Tax=Dongshaea marina TaxID=2047966 RepID=UPI000D3E6E16|nr:glutamyl-tRNA reductase [Dongshaea marina]
MSLFVLGLNHKTAPVSVRERVAIGPEQTGEALRSLLSVEGVEEAVIVSTCNRTELYCEGEPEPESLSEWLESYSQLESGSVANHSYQYQGSQGIHHLLRVVSSLDSLIVGEPQILGQVKTAYQRALELKCAKSVLSRLFEQSFSVAKRIRTETEIGSSAVSTAYAAVVLARQIFADLAKTRILLVGAGEIIELVARHLKEQGVQDIIVANRTRQRAQELASELGAKTATLPDLPELLPDVDIVISSTASPLPLVGKGMVEQALRQRRYRPVLLIDLAVPRDIEAAVDELADAYLYTVDDLNNIIEDNLRSRHQAAEQAEWIAEQEHERLYQWYRSLRSVALVKDYRRDCSLLQRRQLERAMSSLAAGEPADQVLEQLAHRLVNKLSHGPTQLLHHAGREQDHQLLAQLAETLRLDDAL